MRIINLVIITTLLSSCLSQKNELATSIKEVENIYNLNIDLEGHQDKDVEVFRGKIVAIDDALLAMDIDTQKKAANKVNNRSQMENQIIYTLTIYRNDYGTLKYYSANVISLFTYDKATYEWVNDSTVNFNLKNKFHSHESYTVMGYGKTTTLITE